MTNIFMPLIKKKKAGRRFRSRPPGNGRAAYKHARDPGSFPLFSHAQHMASTSDEGWLLELQPSHPQFFSIIHIILQQGEQAETCISTYHWPEYRHMATPSCEGAREVYSLFQGAIGPAKTRDSTKGEENWYRRTSHLLQRDHCRRRHLR